jgi:hypothetical protein
VESRKGGRRKIRKDIRGKVLELDRENLAFLNTVTGTTITNENLIHEEIKRRLNSGNACYHSVQNLLSSRLLSKNIKS